MASWRLPVALILVSATVAAGVGLWMGLGGVDGASDDFRVIVLSPEGEIFNETVFVSNATALTALLVAGGVGDFDVLTREYVGMGTYVYSIAGFTASGSAGWVYEVSLTSGGWTLGDRSAEYYGLPPGAQVRWRWVDKPVVGG